MTKKNAYLLLSAATFALFAQTAQAQDELVAPGENELVTPGDANYYNRTKYESVLDRAQPEFDAEAMRVGTILLRPRLDVSASSDSNVFSTEENEQSDIIARIGGTVSARSDWSVHEVGAVITGHQNEYLDIGEESNFDFRSRFFGRLEATRNLSLSGAAWFEDRTESRTELSNSISNNRPIQFNRSGVSGGVRYQNERVLVTADAQIAEWDYEDTDRAGTGEVVDQDFRDHQYQSATLRTSYAVTPDLAIYGQGRLASRDYDNPTINGGQIFNRDTSSFDLQAGIDFELSSLIRGDIGVGYLEEDRDDDSLVDIDGLSVDGELVWFPSRLTTVTFDAYRRTEEQGIIQAPSSTTSSFGARVDHELKRNIIISAFANTRDIGFDGIDRDDEFNEFGAEGTLKLNKQVHLQVFARLLNRDTSGVDSVFQESFDKETFGVSLQFFPY